MIHRQKHYQGPSMSGKSKMKNSSFVRLVVKAVTDMKDFIEPTGQTEDPKLVGMGLRTIVSIEQLAFTSF